MPEDYNDYPCDTCSSKDHCDGWEAHFCCILCLEDERYRYKHCPVCGKKIKVVEL